MDFTLEQQEIVKPSLPSPLGTIVPLSNLDLVTPAVYMRYILLFPLSVPVSSEQLKKSLSDALTMFPVLAGRFIHTPTNKLAISCCDAGAEFHEAFATFELPDGLDPFVAEKLSPCKRTVDPGCDITDIPLLLVQLTWFPSGKYSLVVAISHNVADGHAASLFTKAWAQICSGKPNLVQKPCFNKNSVKPTQELHYSRPIQLSMVQVNEADQVGRVEASIFKFSKEKIEALKKESSIQNATRFEVITAHIWRSIMKLRNIESHAQTTLYIAVDVRSKLLPPLPDNYFGNCTLSPKITCTVEDLLNNPLGFVIKLVKDAKERVTSNYIVSQVDWIEEHPGKRLVGKVDTRTDLLVTSWARFPLYEADFGNGKPVFVGPLTTLGWIFNYLPAANGEDMYVLMPQAKPELVEIL